MQRHPMEARKSRDDVKYKIFITAALALALLPLWLVGWVNYIVDPLQFYHRARFYQPVFSEEQRFQNPGLAKNYSGDTIIIGSSMTENFVPAEVNELLGGKAVKLSMSGASAREEALIAELALGSGEVKTVLWGLDFASLKGAPDRVRDEDVPFPYYLYDRQPLNDVAYLLSITTLQNSTQILSNFYRGLPATSPELEYLNNWSGEYWFNRQPLLEQWQQEAADRPSGIKLYGGVDGSPAAMQLSFARNILPLVQDHPDVHFIIYYPPYSVLRYRSLWEEDPQFFYAELEVKSYIFAQLQDAPNVSLYDFQADPALSFNLDQYKDYSHHSTLYNRYILEAIAGENKKYLVTAANIDPLRQDLQSQVENLDLELLGQ